MRVLNSTRKTVLSENASRVDSFWGRLQGLMFSKPADMVLAAPRQSVEHAAIHMFFMRYPIDVVWADAGLVVVDVRRRVEPARMHRPKTWGILRPNAPAKYVVELGVGNAGDTRLGDVISFV